MIHEKFDFFLFNRDSTSVVIRTIRKRAVRHLELIQLHSNHLCIEPSDFKVQELLLNGRN